MEKYEIHTNAENKMTKMRKLTNHRHYSYFSAPFICNYDRQSIRPNLFYDQDGFVIFDIKSRIQEDLNLPS